MLHVRQCCSARLPRACALISIALVTIAPPCSASRAVPPARTLVVCADPNNLPFSNRAEAGFENKLVKLVAHDLHAQVQYLWWAQRRGYVRHTMDEAQCDIWPGIATGVGDLATTPPYYRSTYVFVSRRDRGLSELTLDDARLRALTIGVQMIGDNAMNTPPAHALAARGLVANVRGYMLYGDYERPNPPAAIIDAVARREIDVALVWGPLAGYFAQHSEAALTLTPVSGALAAVQAPMVYDISMGVRADKRGLLAEISASLEKERPAIDALLRAYHVPRAPPALAARPSAHGPSG